MNSKIKKENIKFPLRVLGPVKCAYGKINGKFRYRIILKCKNTKEFRKFTHEMLIGIANNKEFSGVSVYSDINGDIGV
jgi:primosomal protein N' (replication factor Y)